MSKGRLIFIAILLAVLLFCFILFNKFIALIVLGLMTAAAFGLKQPIKRFWRILDDK